MKLCTLQFQIDIYQSSEQQQIQMGSSNELAWIGYCIDWFKTFQREIIIYERLCLDI